MEKNKGLPTGEKYLSISLKVGELLALCIKASVEGQKYVNIAGFKNKEKSKETEADYSGAEASIWIKTKQAKTTEEKL